MRWVCAPLQSTATPTATLCTSRRCVALAVAEKRERKKMRWRARASFRGLSGPSLSRQELCGDVVVVDMLDVIVVEIVGRAAEGKDECKMEEEVEEVKR